MTTPGTLAELRAMPPGPDRIKAAEAYIAQRQQAINDARAIRNADIRALVAEEGLAETARLTDMKLATVKAARGQKA